MEFEMGATIHKLERDYAFEDLDLIVSNIESIPSMIPRLQRIGTSKPQEDKNKHLSVVEIGFRNFRKGQLNFNEYDLYE